MKNEMMKNESLRKIWGLACQGQALQCVDAVNKNEYTNSIKKYIGQGLPKLTPVEIVGYEAAETGSSAIG